jgi:hypothetical protein
MRWAWYESYSGKVDIKAQINAYKYLLYRYLLGRPSPPNTAFKPHCIEEPSTHLDSLAGYASSIN